ncbi:putative mitotic spindle assembly checkpoint protein [Trypoxylus dichotomus]
MELLLIKRYVFDIVHSKGTSTEDLYIDLEQSFHDFCLKLHAASNFLDKLLSESTFIIQLYISEYNSMEFAENVSYQDFPWILINLKNWHDAEIIPIHSINTNILKDCNKNQPPGVQHTVTSMENFERVRPAVLRSPKRSGRHQSLILDSVQQLRETDCAQRQSFAVWISVFLDDEPDAPHFYEWWGAIPFTWLRQPTKLQILGTEKSKTA